MPPYTKIYFRNECSFGVTYKCKKMHKFYHILDDEDSKTIWGEKERDVESREIMMKKWNSSSNILTVSTFDCDTSNPFTVTSSIRFDGEGDLSSDFIVKLCLISFSFWLPFSSEFSSLSGSFSLFSSSEICPSDS